jgi:hypothetical protein
MGCFWFAVLAIHSQGDPHLGLTSDKDPWDSQTPGTHNKLHQGVSLKPVLADLQEKETFFCLGLAPRGWDLYHNFLQRILSKSPHISSSWSSFTLSTSEPSHGFSTPGFYPITPLHGVSVSTPQPKLEWTELQTSLYASQRRNADTLQEGRKANNSNHQKLRL